MAARATAARRATKAPRAASYTTTRGMAQHGHGPAEEEQSAAVGRDVLVVAGAGAEEVAELVVTSAEPGGRGGTRSPAWAGSGP
jgi:hypothetical protein